jgi:hypothetical protein
MRSRCLVVLLLLPLQAASTPRRAATRVGPLAAAPSDDAFMPWTCKGTVDLAASRIGRIPRLESDATQRDGPWSLDALKRGLPCSFALSRDRAAAAVVVKTGQASYYVLFFNRDELARAQMIHGPWELAIQEKTPATFPPILEQVAAGDAGFLYRYDHETRMYREEAYPYPPDYEMGE